MLPASSNFNGKTCSQAKDRSVPSFPTHIIPHKAQGGLSSSQPDPPAQSSQNNRPGTVMLTPPQSRSPERGVHCLSRTQVGGKHGGERPEKEPLALLTGCQGNKQRRPQIFLTAGKPRANPGQGNCSVGCKETLLPRFPFLVQTKSTTLTSS